LEVGFVAQRIEIMNTGEKTIDGAAKLRLKFKETRPIFDGLDSLGYVFGLSHD